MRKKHNFSILLNILAILFASISFAILGYMLYLDFNSIPNIDKKEHVMSLVILISCSTLFIFSVTTSLLGLSKLINVRYGYSKKPSKKYIKYLTFQAVITTLILIVPILFTAYNLSISQPTNEGRNYFIGMIFLIVMTLPVELIVFLCTCISWTVRVVLGKEISD